MEAIALAMEWTMTAFENIVVAGATGRRSAR
jgi:hypothetical protein